MLRPLCIVWCVFALVLCAAAAEFPWQEPQAIVTDSGAIQWNPKPFVDDLAGQDVRYIDYGAGNDDQNGTTPASAWKHHPWDYDATGNAVKCSGVKTYVFRRGVLYRGQLLAKHSGTAQQPIRLTSTATWGEGEAIFVGSKRLPTAWVPATKVVHPQRLAEPEKVWTLDLSKTDWWNRGLPGFRASAEYRSSSSNRVPVEPPFIGLYTYQPDGQTARHHLASNPNWQAPGTEFAHDYWPAWDGDGQKNNRGVQTGAWDADLKGFPQDYFTGAVIWTTWPSLMGGATPIGPLPATYKDTKVNATVPMYDPERGYFNISQLCGFSKGTRYRIENLPQYLDTAGEFYLDGATSQLHFRPADGVSPNDLDLELVVNIGQITIPDQSYIEVSGLGFRYANRVAIRFSGSCAHITVHHCRFQDLLGMAFQNDMMPSQVDWNTRYANHPEIAKLWKADRQEHLAITDNDFSFIGDRTIQLQDATKESSAWPYGRLGHVDILRNRLEDIGIRHQGSKYSSISAISLGQADTAVIAGNVVRRSFGGGIQVSGGMTEGRPGSDWPLTRILIYHNSTDDTALGVNDYGGFSLWQGGPIYVFNNNIGNSVGFLSGGIFSSGKPTTLSYPYYIDGGYKVMGFNNVIWNASADPKDIYASRTGGYFSVFGFLNHFTNNTLYRHGRGLDGSSGNRTDIIANIFADITGQYLQNNRVENASLVGGGDTGASGIHGVPSLAYGLNVFHGSAKAGELVASNADNGINVPLDIKADSLAQMATQMQSFPLRYGQLGTKVDILPIVGETTPHGMRDSGAQAVDFRLTKDSPAIDAGATYFVPWPLAANVGEWNFTENRANPTRVVDYAFYMSEAHYQRFMYDQIPDHSLTLNGAALADYVPAPSEDWVNGALRFDGTRFGFVTDAEMRKDIELIITEWITGKGQTGWEVWNRRPKELWVAPEPANGYDEKRNPKYSRTQTAKYPGEHRNTLISKTRNLLLEVKFRTDAQDTGGVLLNKWDGASGYKLAITAQGRGEFTLASAGKVGTAATTAVVNDGIWHHLLAEVDRATGRMTIHLDGKQSGEAVTPFGADASVDCAADFVIGKSSAGNAGYFRGAIDFMRVCHGTLSDAKTSIGELYAWQYTDGPALVDMRGRKPLGIRRDAGALEVR